MRIGRWVMAGLLSLGAAAAVINPAAAFRPVTIMPLGASITYGYGSSDGNGYRGVLHDRLTRDAGMAVDFVGSQRSGSLADSDHEGHPGWRIDQIAACADGWMRAYRPQIVVMHLGTNDMIQDFGTPTAPERLAALADRLAATGATVYVSSLVASADPDIDARIDAFNARLPALLAGHRGVVYVDQSRALGPGDLTDKVHPGDAGYARIADIWYAALT
ncbi:SGNH/GDSL hydrolase family protein [Actinoplanes sp. NPDC051475]|uniref:SGNH/GDSL hydrolase family protein n=1 Tax=Actinoplanes sp. NPDC051475 TaxID=3157225 RepID=UPI003450117E